MPRREYQHREYQHSEDQLSFAWKTSRPFYMREIEPLAHQGAWPSPPVPAANKDNDLLLTPEQQENRAILMAAKRRAASCQLPAASERKTG
jgi:hypothetical protein